MVLVFASNNEHKLSEVRAIVSNNITILSQKEIGFCDEVEETGQTLEANSLLKANAVWQWIQSHHIEQHIDGVIADDTGLEIEALNGEPGVRTARWTSDKCNDKQNRLKALQLLHNQSNRNCRFRTVITLIQNGATQQVEGEVKGSIAQAEYGSDGFGYDPLFVPQGYNITFAQMTAEQKNTISHRGRALANLAELLHT